MSTHHIKAYVVLVKSQKPMMLNCTHCCSLYKIDMPCPAALLAAIIDKFVSMHEDCEDGMVDDD